MNRLLDVLAFIIVGTLALAFIALVVIMVVRDPWTIAVLAFIGSFWWAGARLLKKL